MPTTSWAGCYAVSLENLCSNSLDFDRPAAEVKCDCMNPLACGNTNDVQHASLFGVPLRAEDLPLVSSPAWVKLIHDHVIPYVTTLHLVDIPLQPEVVARGFVFTLWAMLLWCIHKLGNSRVGPSGNPQG